MVPSYATTGALVYEAILMLGGMEQLDWSDNAYLCSSKIFYKKEK